MNSKKHKTLKERQSVILAILCIAIVIGGFAVMAGSGYLIIDTNVPLGGGNCNFTYSIFGIDEDGNEISIPIDNTLFSGFTIGGISAVSLGVRISWESTGTAIDWTTLTITAKLDMAVVSAIDYTIIPAETGPGTKVYFAVWSVDRNLTSSSNLMNGSWVNTFTLGATIAENNAYKVDGSLLATTVQGGEPGFGWLYKIKGSIHATAFNTIGELKDASADLGAFFVWIQYSSTLTVSGTIATD